MNTSRYITAFVATVIYTSTWWLFGAGPTNNVKLLSGIAAAIYTVAIVICILYEIIKHWNDGISSTTNNMSKHFEATVVRLFVTCISTAVYTSGYYMLILLRKYTNEAIAPAVVIIIFGSIGLGIVIIKWVMDNWKIKS